jgi:hypothetical protein
MDGDVSYRHTVAGNYDLFPCISKDCMRLMLSCIAFKYVHEPYVVSESQGSQYSDSSANEWPC